MLNGLELNYAEAGSGTPMIFMHNGGGFWQSWKRQLEYFSRNYHVYGLDWPGFGESQAPEGLVTLELLSATLKEFISLLNTDKVILVGNCIGASAALHFANRFPQKVEKLLLFNICPGDLIFPHGYLRPVIRQLGRSAVLRAGAGTVIRFAFTKTPVRKKFPSILFSKEFSKDDDLFRTYVMKNKTKKQNAARTNQVFSVHTFRLDRFIPGAEVFPHILVWGEKNSVISLEQHGYFSREILQPVSFLTVPDAGHLCMYEQPDYVNKIIINYLNS